MDALPVPLILEIADFVGILTFIKSISLVSKSLSLLILKDCDFFRILVTSRTRSLPDLMTSRRYLLPDAYWSVLFKELVRTRALVKQAEYLTISPVGRSSADATVQEIDCTVSPTLRFWSSTGSTTPESNEYLIYSLQEKTLVTTVEISFYQALYQLGRPCYASQRVRVSVGDRLGEYHYVSPDFSVSNIPNIQTLPIYPAIVSGKFVRIDLLGKQQTQAPDNRFYSCVRWLSVRGIDLVCLKQNQRTPVLANQFLPESVPEIPVSQRIDLAELATSMYSTRGGGSFQGFSDLCNICPLQFRTFQFYEWLLAHGSEVVVDHLYKLDPPLTPLECVLGLELTGKVEHRWLFPGYEEVGDFLIAENFEIAKMVYQQADCLNNILTCDLRSAVEQGTATSLRGLIRMRGFDGDEAMHLLSEALVYYGPNPKLLQEGDRLVRQGAASQAAWEAAKAGPVPSPTGLPYVDFFKKRKAQKDILFVGEF